MNSLNILGAAGAAAPRATPEQEAMARKAGYPSYEAMRAYLIKRAQPNQNPATGGPVPGQPSVEAASAWHPKSIFNYISEALRGARQ